ncbi:TIGR03560 family F420-dependent LLM class oxidoreductase [Acidimicrobiia bacterium EGI L10123]|uniref:TIGR03560 family F420-dependent LLM class oxidoreductase n=1 Tax=Salinilacustrithrix flava TaxID=2957203 RepID=UPI003D7C2F67|nr:TIGR03560 family F420-dependent LLM class oxidoreductase [Acidimicrobiia bacterium EGI L10123]
MQFAVWPGTQQSWADILEVARHAELTGWDRVYVADHFMSNDDEAAGPMLECWAVVTALAAAVPRVGIGTLVCGNTYRHPAILANQAAAADVISGGRVILGLGAGWQQNEHDKYGIELYSVGERLDRFAEACAIVRSLSTQERTTFHGEHYQLTDAPMEPKPVGPFPLLVGGGGEKRTLRVAAEHAQEWNVWSTPEIFAHKSGVLDGHCQDLGRDPSEIHRSTQALLFLSDDQAFLDRMRGMDMPMPTLIGTPSELVDVVGAYRDAGVDELIVPDFTIGTGTQRTDILDRFKEEVAIHFG